MDANPSAREIYDQWLARLAELEADREELERGHLGAFYKGLHALQDAIDDEPRRPSLRLIQGGA